MPLRPPASLPESQPASVLELLADLLSKCRFPDPGERIDCAVSGGADSMALMVLAAAAGCRVHAYHVDHRLRPGGAEEADLVKQAATRFGAEFTALVTTVEPGPNLEARARDARRSLMPPGTATGHTADDQAETILLNLMRGSGSAGLAGMRWGSVHPILHLRREETHRLCSELGLEVVDDPSNRDYRFRRNRVRSQLLPLMNDISGRDLVPVLCRQAELLAEESDWLDQRAARLDPGDIAGLRNAGRVLARRAVRTHLAHLLAAQPSLSMVERVLSLVDGRCRATDIAGGLSMRRVGDRLVPGTGMTTN